MPTVSIARAVRRGDDVTVTGAVDGEEAQAHLWWSYLVGLTPAQRRTAAAQALAAEAAARAETDLGITGTVTV